jgi:hypothetical protein
MAWATEDTMQPDAVSRVQIRWRLVQEAQYAQMRAVFGAFLRGSVSVFNICNSGGYVPCPEKAALMKWLSRPGTGPTKGKSSALCPWTRGESVTHVSVTVFVKLRLTSRPAAAFISWLAKLRCTWSRPIFDVGCRP